MKYFIIFIGILFVPFLTNAQEIKTSDKKFGFSLVSSFNNEVNPIRLTPSVSYFSGNNQFELGVGFHPFIQQEQKIISSEFNYKYFPNGFHKKFNMYLMASFTYLNNRRETFYPATYNYLFLNGGYGVQVALSKNIYLGTNANFGIFTYSKKSDNPYINYAEGKGLFNEFGDNFELEFTFGYRF